MKEILTTLLSLEKEIREQNSISELSFFIAHQIKLLFPYKRSVVFSSYKDKSIKIESISGVIELDKYSPYQQTLEKIIKKLIKKSNHSHENKFYLYEKSELENLVDSQLDEIFQNKLLFYPFYNQDVLIGGILFFVDDFTLDEKKQYHLQFLLEAINYSFCYLTIKEKKLHKFIYSSNKKQIFYTILIAFILSIFFIRVPLTVIADAVITARDPKVITAPMDGVIEKVNVNVAQSVKKGELLFNMEKQDLLNANEQALSEYRVIKEKLNKAIQSSFKDIKNRAEINILKAELRLKALQVTYTQYLLNQANVYSPQDGIAIIDSPHEWSGKPVQIGEKVLEIANKEKVKISIWLPVSDALYFEKGDRVILFLNAKPLSPIDATVAYSGFDAQKSPKELLAYKVTAFLDKGVSPPRIGSQGNAKLYHGKVSLFYYLFRRPLTYLRQHLGF